MINKMKESNLHKIQAFTLLVAAVLFWIPHKGLAFKITGTIIIGINAFLEFIS